MLRTRLRIRLRARLRARGHTFEHTHGAHISTHEPRPLGIVFATEPAMVRREVVKASRAFAQHLVHTA